jgi:hypothetical protein
VIKFSIYGCSKDKRLKDRVGAAAVFFLQQLMPRKRNIEIRIKLVKDLLAKENTYGECYDLDASASGDHYTIRLDYADNVNAIISTLAHEMVHIKQFARDELRMLYTGYCAKWKGTKYVDDDVDYETCPWEVEANRIEPGLSAAFASKYPVV